MRYRIFKRRWWKEATEPGWPKNLEPDATAHKTTIRYADSEEEAIRICREHNATNDPGRYSMKYEFEHT